MRTFIAMVTAIWLSTQSVLAFGHDLQSRQMTLAKLSLEVSQECGFFKTLFTARCRELNSLVRALYRDPNVATKSDLAVLDRMAELGKVVSKERNDLALAIENTKAIFAHVVIDHGGNWEFEVCGPNKPS